MHQKVQKKILFETSPKLKILIIEREPVHLNIFASVNQNPQRKVYLMFHSIGLLKKKSIRYIINTF
jgi:hypothetical protein